MGTIGTIHLRTLGAVGLTGLNGEACARVLAQPKRLALLAYLAARRPGERVSRDRILSVFWPELSADRARANLRNALYFLRGELGRDIIEGRGATIVLSQGLVCDASLLLAGSLSRDGESVDGVDGSVLAAASSFQAVGSGVAGDALLALYRGEFLDGLHVSGAPDFERWVDRTRAALRARASDAAWRMADRAESSGAWISAARYARLATDLAVDVEGATQRLIRLLDRAGDRAAALAEYDRLSSWLDAEFEIPPSPETTSLIAGVRERVDPVEGGSSLASERPTPSRAQSLAVLPFEDLSDGAGAAIAGGVAEDLLTALSSIRGVRVSSRTSVRRLVTADRTPSMREIHELLDVDLVLEGSVQLQGDRVRITAQLIDASRDSHVWAQSYDRLLSDVFEIQSDVALRVARALEAELSPREHEHLRRRPTSSLRAWQLYLSGREIWRNRDPSDAERAAALFRRALEVDDRFARAWVGLADACLVRTATGAASIEEMLVEAKQAVRRAMDCDPDLGEAHATLGLIRTFFEPDHRVALMEYRAAVELSPGYATAHQWYGNLLCGQGEVDKGLSELALAIDLDPLAPALGDSLGLGLYHAGRIDEAEAQFHQTLELDESFWRSHLSLALCHATRGDPTHAAEELVEVWTAGGYGATRAEAAEAARCLVRGPAATFEFLLRTVRSRLQRVPALRVLEIVLLMLLDRHPDAIAALEAARDNRSIGFILMYAPILDPLTGRRQFHELMAEVGLDLPRWRQTG